MILPGIANSIPGPLIPQAPSEMHVGLAKNDQKLYVIPSQNMVIIRMGNPSAGTEPMQVVYDRHMWERIAALPCATSANEALSEPSAPVWPNPASDILHHRGTKIVLRALDGTYIAESVHGGLTTRTLFLVQ